MGGGGGLFSDTWEEEGLGRGRLGTVTLLLSLIGPGLPPSFDGSFHSPRSTRQSLTAPSPLDAPPPRRRIERVLPPRVRFVDHVTAHFRGVNRDYYVSPSLLLPGFKTTAVVVECVFHV